MTQEIEMEVAIRMPTTVQTQVQIDLEDLAQDLSRLPSDGLLKFVLDLDEYIAELEFTIKLRDAFNRIIEENE